MGQTQRGNNNTYCQDNELNWLNWGLLEVNGELFNFVKHCIAFRKAQPALRSPVHVSNGAADGIKLSWHGTRAWNADWSGAARTLAFMLHGHPTPPGVKGLDYIYVAMNMHWEANWFELPGLPPGMSWRVSTNTGVSPPGDTWRVGAEPRLPEQAGFLVGERSVVVLVGR
jgi:glycogen operon protein